jgi:hypothetical protein
MLELGHSVTPGMGPWITLHRVRHVRVTPALSPWAASDDRHLEERRFGEQDLDHLCVMPPLQTVHVNLTAPRVVPVGVDLKTQREIAFWSPVPCNLPASGH